MQDNVNVPDWDGRNKNRTPMQWTGGIGAGFTSRQSNETWLPIHPNYISINLQSQRERQDSTYKYYQTLTALRKKRAFREGSYQAEAIKEHVFAYAR
jgi:glycosidase